MNTLVLNEDWDITLAENGTLATVDTDYATAQKVANEVRLFTQDAFFNQQNGIPHFNIELGSLPPQQILKQRIKQAALAVEGVVSATVSFSSLEDRVLTGAVNVRLQSNEVFDVDI